MSKTVRLQFESGLEYQQAAISAVCDLLEGLERREAPFSIRELPEGEGLALESTGYGNALNVADDLLNPLLLANLRAVQERGGLPMDESLECRDFTVEMETGTGKTYVYLRTICELHKRYGLSRFVIVVPSVAIKEGVTKSIELMRPHFRALYHGLSLDSFTYDSKRVSEVADFARRSTLRVMVCTIQAITDIENAAAGKGKQATRVMYQNHERTGGSRPIDIIRNCRPVVIVDEPQRVGKKGEINGLSNLNPLFTLRYSATPKNVIHPVYRLNAVDAASQHLVKSIEVASIEKSGGAIGPYMRVVSVKEQGGRRVAVVKLRVRGRNGVERLENCELREEDSLQVVSQNPAVYPEGLKVLPFHREGKGKKAIGYVELMTPTGVQRVYEGGSYSDDDLVREMMAVTIETHLDRALHLNMQGIKVLSLFFLDSVSHYRLFDSETKQEDWGEYALLFEEIYTQIASREKYRTLFGGSPPPARSVHNGYFAKSKKTKTEPAHYTDKPGGEQEQSAYELIMKDKERLLSRDEPLQFIFTHSALQEGWDNPNVFQICILRDIRTTMSRRQALGRGLRLCVNESGSRVYDTNINRLTVIARESVKEFAAKLQKEYEAEGCRFGVITKESMGTLRFTNANGETEVLGQAQAQHILAELTQGGLLQKDKPTLQLREALEDNNLQKPASCPQAAWNVVKHYLHTQSQGVKVQDARERRCQSVDMDVFLSPLFHELWERIKYRTTYRAHFQTEKLIEAVLADLPEALSSLHRNVVVHVGEVDVAEAGVRAEELRMRVLQEVGQERRGVCDVLSYLEDATNLTRRTLAAILTKLPPETFRLIYQDESGFLKTVIRIIKMHLSRIRTACLEYMPVTVGERVYDAQRFLEEQEESYTSKMLAVTKGKCLTDCIIYDQSVESRFAESAEKCENVKLYFKLPSWFKIPTPLGNYNPDWAVVMENGGAQNLYFVVETKSLESLTELEAEVGGNQADKVRCGKAHFAAAVQQRAHALEPPAEYRGPITRVEDVLHC